MSSFLLFSFFSRPLVSCFFSFVAHLSRSGPYSFLFYVSFPSPFPSSFCGRIYVSRRCYLSLGNDTGQPNPTGSQVRVSLGLGVGHGESTRDPGPTISKATAN